MGSISSEQGARPVPPEHLDAWLERFVTRKSGPRQTTQQLGPQSSMWATRRFHMVEADQLRDPTLDPAVETTYLFAGSHKRLQVPDVAQFGIPC